MLREDARRREKWGSRGWRRFAMILSMNILLAVPLHRATAQEVAKKDPALTSARPEGRPLAVEQVLFHLQFDGLDAHANAWRKTAAYRLINETKLGILLEEALLQGIELFEDFRAQEPRLPGVDVVSLIKHISQNGFDFAITQGQSRETRMIAVLRRGDRPEIKDCLDLIGAAKSSEGHAEKANRATIEHGGRTFHRFGNDATWLVEKGDLIVATKMKPQEILERDAVGHALAPDHMIRKHLRTPENGFEPFATGFVDVSAFAPEELGAGFEGLKWLELRWGFQGDALLTRFRVEAPAPRTGWMTLLDQPTFGVDALPPLPGALTHVSVLSLELTKAYDLASRLLRDELIPADGDPADAGLLARHQVNLRDDILAHLGPKLAFFAETPPAEDHATTAAILMSHLTGFAFTAETREEAAARGVESLIKSFGPILRDLLQRAPRDLFGRSWAFLKFQRLAGSRRGYTLDFPPEALPVPYLSGLRPTLIFDRDQIVFGASTTAAHQAMLARKPWQPAGPFGPLVKQLAAENLIYLGLNDPRAGTLLFERILPIIARQINVEVALARQRSGKNSAGLSLKLDRDVIPSASDLNRFLYPSTTTVVVDPRGATLEHREAILTLTSPITAAIALGILQPSLASARESARRAECMNHLRSISRSITQYRQANQAFPRAAITDKNGNALLSWRVAILPFMEQRELYDKFKLDERWDSPHNMALLKEMPRVYRCPGRVRAEPFTTAYRVYVGNGALFEKARDLGMADVTDGASNTITVVETEETVPWTKPDEIVFQPAGRAALQGAGSAHRGGFHAALADNTVRFIRDTIAPEVFRALITRAGGEPVNPGEF